MKNLLIAILLMAGCAPGNPYRDCVNSPEAKRVQEDAVHALATGRINRSDQGPAQFEARPNYRGGFDIYRAPGYQEPQQQQVLPPGKSTIETLSDSIRRYNEQQLARERTYYGTDQWKVDAVRRKAVEEFCGEISRQPTEAHIKESRQNTLVGTAVTAMFLGLSLMVDNEEEPEQISNYSPPTRINDNPTNTNPNNNNPTNNNPTFVAPDRRTWWERDRDAGMVWITYNGRATFTQTVIREDDILKVFPHAELELNLADRRARLIGDADHRVENMMVNDRLFTLDGGVVYMGSDDIGLDVFINSLWIRENGTTIAGTITTVNHPNENLWGRRVDVDLERN